jgi:hypothetical protein
MMKRTPFSPIIVTHPTASQLNSARRSSTRRVSRANIENAYVPTAKPGTARPKQATPSRSSSSKKLLHTDSQRSLKGPFGYQRGPATNASAGIQLEKQTPSTAMASPRVSTRVELKEIKRALLNYKGSSKSKVLQTAIMTS